MKAKQSRPTTRSYKSSFVAYYCTIGIFLLGWAIPETRVWGFNWWAYQPTLMQAALLLIAAIAGPLLWMWSKRYAAKVSLETLPPEPAGKYWTLVTITLVAFTGLYYAFPSTTHFLGDGYYLLTRLAEKTGTLKSWDIGASLINDTVIGALGSQSKENALLAFRIIAVTSGLLMLVMVSFFSYKLYERFMDRVLFFVGIASCGYALHFFGYVENYALFVVMIFTFTLLGLLAVQGKISRWLAIIPAILASGLHIFGLTLMPPLLYILLFDKKPLVRFGQMKRKNRNILLAAIGVIAVGAYFYLFYNYYFFRFAFLPFIPERFTVDNDYLLSVKHLSDFVNLMVMLVPGVGLFIAELLAGHRKQLWSGPDNRFLVLLLASTMACIYLFNPGHGMPRNWDLFSLPGIPLSVLVFYTLLSSKHPSRRRFLTAASAITLGFLLLIPRVSSQWTPEIAITHFKNYVELDRTRNRNARRLLTDYYRNHGNEDAANRWNSLAVQSFPEAGLTNQGKQLLQSGKYDQAESLFLRALQINPIFVDAYSNLGTCYISRGQLDRALEYLEIADGLNPLNASIINNKGTIFLRRGDLQAAENQFLEALRVDAANSSAMAGLVSVNVKNKNDQQTSVYLEMMRGSSELPVEYFEQGAGVCMEAGLENSARLSFAIAIELGLASARQQELLTKYPTLKP